MGFKSECRGGYCFEMDIPDIIFWDHEREALNPEIAFASVILEVPDPNKTENPQTIIY